MPKRPYPNMIDDALRGERLTRQPSSRQIARMMDRILTANPRMSGQRQSIVEMEIRDEIARRRGNRIRWPF
jgi:hypothetical protein